MSDIIIEGKNLNDINQSNFQTVGVRSSFYFIKNPNLTLEQINQSNMTYDTLQNFEESLGDDYQLFTEESSFGAPRSLFPKELLEIVSIEPWQGRLHYDVKKDEGGEIIPIEPDVGLSLVKFFNGEIQIEQDGFGNLTLEDVASLMNSMTNPESPLFYPYFYMNSVFSNDGNSRFKLNNFYAQLQNDSRLGLEERSPASIIIDDRFPLGTYTEENKQFWELQTSDPVLRASQFSSERMKTALSEKVGDLDLIRSEEEQFSVDAFTFTERDGVITPLFFYYDKKLHPTEYKNATNGKVNMRIELRESGRNVNNELDLYQERKVVRPFLMGFEKDELRNGGFTEDNPPEERIGTGDIFGEGLYYGGTYITLGTNPSPDSYLLGIYDIPDDNLKSNTVGNYSFIMPDADIQYLAKFRPNPYLVVTQRFRDANGTPTSGGPDAKGEVRAWVSEVTYFGNETTGAYLTTPPNFRGSIEQYQEEIQAAQDQFATDIENGMSISEAATNLQSSIPILDFGLPAFKTPGNRFIDGNFKPKDFGGDYITLEQREVTNNFKFKGWSFLSGSDSIETPLTEVPQTQAIGPDGQSVTVDVDQNYNGQFFGNPGGSVNNIKTIKLREDFRYPNGRLTIIANYGLIMFTIENLNNQVDFENNFADALKYGPFKFVTAMGNSPNIDDYRFDNITQFPAFEVGEPRVRLLLSGPDMGYANADYLPSGENANLIPLEDISGYAPGDFFYYRNTGEGTGTEKIPIKIDINEPIPNTMANAIELNGGSGPTPTTVQGSEPVTVGGTTFYDTQPSNYSVGTLDSTGLFKVTSVDYLSTNNVGGVYGLTWGPNITNQTRTVNKFQLDENERPFYEGIQLGDVALAFNNFDEAVDQFGPPPFFSSAYGAYTLITANDVTTPPAPFEVGFTTGGPNNNLYIIEDLSEPIEILGINDFHMFNRYEITWNINPNLDASFSLLSSHVTNEIVSTENTSSISYEPLQKGTYIKSIDLGANTSLTTAIVESDTSISGRVRSKEDSGAIDADMYGFGQTYRITMTPSEESMPPEIDVFLAQENGDLTLSSNLYTGLTKSTLGVEWNPDDWSPNGGGSLSYTVPESRDAFLTINGVNVPLYWKYIEFRIQTLQTAEGEQSENNEPVDPSFYVGLNVFGMPGAGGQIFNDFQNDQEPVLVSTGGLVNLFNIAETVDENGIPYQEFSQVPSGQRTIVLRAVPSSGGFPDANSVGTWSFMVDPGVDVDTVGSITQFWVGDPENDNFGHHLGIITFNQEGPVTVKYQWFSGQGGP